MLSCPGNGFHSRGYSRLEVLLAAPRKASQNAVVTLPPTIMEVDGNVDGMAPRKTP